MNFYIFIIHIYYLIFLLSFFSLRSTGLYLAMPRELLYLENPYALPYAESLIG